MTESNYNKRRKLLDGEESTVDSDDEQTVVESVKLKGKRRKTEKVELNKRKKGKEKADIPAEEQETEELNDEDKALILAWGEDPGIKWVSEQSRKSWKEFLPSTKEMPPNWPGEVSLEGLRPTHLTPDYWRSDEYNGNRDVNGWLKGA